jgi:hypothetical protein
MKVLFIDGPALGRIMDTPDNRGVVLVPGNFDIINAPYGAASEPTLYHVHRVLMFGFMMNVGSMKSIQDDELNADAFDLLITDLGKQIVDRRVTGV